MPRGQADCKPSSVPFRGRTATIHLGPRLPGASCDQPEGGPGALSPPIWSCSEWGLPSRPVTRPLVRSYRTVSPLPFPNGKGGLSLWHFPSRRRAWALPSTLPGGARTFLSPISRRAAARPPGHVYSTKREALALLLFQASDRGRVAAGEIRVTFRLWKYAHVKAGKIYPTGFGEVLIEDVQLLPAALVTEEDVRLSGCHDIAAVWRSAGDHTKTRVGPDTLLYRVRFRFVEPEAEGPTPVPGPGRFSPR